MKLQRGEIKFYVGEKGRWTVRSITIAGKLKKYDDIIGRLYFKGGWLDLPSGFIPPDKKVVEFERIGN